MSRIGNLMLDLQSRVIHRNKSDGVVWVEECDPVPASFLAELEQRRYKTRQFRYANKAAKYLETNRAALIVVNPWLPISPDSLSDPQISALFEEYEANGPDHGVFGQYLVERARAEGSPNKRTPIVAYYTNDRVLGRRDFYEGHGIQLMKQNLGRECLADVLSVDYLLRKMNGK
jgi:hypothetical protein